MLPLLSIATFLPILGGLVLMALPDRSARVTDRKSVV